MSSRNFKTDALVLKSRPLGEADRLITLLTWEKGKLAAVARGARKTKSRLAAGVDLFTYGHYLLHRGRSLAVITGQVVKEHFHHFREQPELYPYGLYLGELADRFIIGEEPCPEACSHLLEGWRMLGGPVDRPLLCRAFELKMADLAGYRPFLQGCLQCGASRIGFFSPRRGGTLCLRCRGADAIPVEPGTVALAGRLLEAPLQQVRLVRPQPHQLRQLAAMTGSFLRYHLDAGEFKSLRLLAISEMSEAPGIK